MAKRSREMQRVNKFVTKYRRLFGLNGPTGWTTVVEMSDADLDVSPNAALRQGEAAATVDADSSYKMATITFDRNQVRDHNDEDLETLVRHEMVHLLLQPLVTFTDDLFETMPQANKRRLKKAFNQVNERVTTDLTNIMGRW